MPARCHWRVTTKIIPKFLLQINGIETEPHERNQDKSLTPQITFQMAILPWQRR